MQPRQIKDNIFAVGAVDWDRKLFDALIPLPDGQFVSYLSAIGLKATDSIGAYRGACNPVDVVILLKNPRWARRAAA